ncbi:hypothetical protein [Mycobacteroides abscessus]|nr:hypothetical protein [Mycobacteroides abscessus]
MALRPNNDLAGAVVFRVQQLLADLLAQRCIDDVAEQRQTADLTAG